MNDQIKKSLCSWLLTNYPGPDKIEVYRKVLGYLESNSFTIEFFDWREIVDIALSQNRIKIVTSYLRFCKLRLDEIKIGKIEKLLTKAGVPEEVFLNDDPTVPLMDAASRLEWYLARRKNVKENKK